MDTLIRSWRVDIALLSGQRHSITVHTGLTNRSLVEQARLTWRVPLRCQTMVCGSRLLDRDAACDFGTEDHPQVTLLLRMDAETLLGTGTANDVDEAKHALVALARRDVAQAHRVLHDIQDYFIDRALDARSNRAVTKGDQTRLMTVREASLALLRGTLGHYQCFSCDDTGGRAEQYITFSAMDALRLETSTGYAMVPRTDRGHVVQRFRRLAAAELFVEALCDVHAVNENTRDAVDTLFNTGRDPHVIHEALGFFIESCAERVPSVWVALRGYLRRQNGSQTARLLKLFFSRPGHLTDTDVTLAAGRLRTWPLEERGAALRVLGAYARQGHPEVVEALVACLNEHGCNATPTIPRTLGHMACPGDPRAIEAIRHCLGRLESHSEVEQPPRTRAAQRATVQDALRRELHAAWDRLRTPDTDDEELLESESPLKTTGRGQARGRGHADIRQRARRPPLQTAGRGQARGQGKKTTGKGQAQGRGDTDIRHTAPLQHRGSCLPHAPSRSTQKGVRIHNRPSSGTTLHNQGEGTRSE